VPLFLFFETKVPLFDMVGDDKLVWYDDACSV
jgi:hypothetical protein